MMLQAATDIRKEVNVLDNQTTGKAVDALLNYETVALFNNQVLLTQTPSALLQTIAPARCGLASANF